MKFGDLGVNVYDEICQKLNVPSFRKDYRSLAGKMKYTNEQVQIFELKDNRARALLDHWGTKTGNDVERLLEMLSSMERDDLVGILKKELKDFSRFNGK